MCVLVLPRLGARVAAPCPAHAGSWQLHASAAAGHAADVVCAALTVRPLPLPAQDLGHNDVGWANNRTRTPHLDALVKDGVELLQW